MKKNEIIIFGCGETALLAYEYFTHDSEYEVVAFTVDKEFLNESSLFGLPVIATEEIVKKYPPECYGAFVAASSTKLNRVRKQLYMKAVGLGYELVSYVSSRAFVWQNVKIGQNCFILEDNTLQPFTEVGNNVVMWSGNHLGHRSVIKDHCFISSHCVISGFCEIGESSFLGVNSTLEDGVKLDDDNFIGAASLIQKSSACRALYQERQTDISKVTTHKLFRIKE
ncbi:acetyltransferase [Zobellella denitrificans]|uniref:acetyltransferase n=1 Tax=Zobellella denitrificans TaxID=347534 RepID=UPI000BBE2578|nr:acetyltransferase [Zobellella denitrificans]